MLELVATLLCYIPATRKTAVTTLEHSWFHELREPGANFEGRPLPPL